MRQGRVKLAALLDGEFFGAGWSGFFPSGRGRPASPSRLVAGHFYLQHTRPRPDKAVVTRWRGTCVRHVCGGAFFQHHMPIDPSPLVRWRKRIGEVEAWRAMGSSAMPGVAWLLAKTREAGCQSGAADDGGLTRVAVDTTVMETLKGERGCSAAA